MILNEQELDSYRAGHLAIDLPNATLTQRGGLETPDVLSGPAHISQLDDGRFKLTLYATREALTGVRSWGGRKPGSWVEDIELYDLHGHDISGREWTAHRLHIAEKKSAASHVTVCSAEVHEVHCKRDYSRDLPCILWAWFPGSFSLPVNTYTTTNRSVGSQTTEDFELNVWEFAIGNRSVLLLRHSDALELEVASKDPIPSAYHTRIQEALWLTLARRIEPSAVVLQNGRQIHARLTSLRASVGRPRLQPPLDLRDPQYAEAAANLVNSYLGATQSHDTNELFHHPLGVAISRVLRASQVDIEMEALVLSIALEGLAAEYFLHLGEPDPELKAAVEIVTKSITASEGLTPYQDRMLNAVKNMSRSTGRSALGRLSKLGVITPEQHKVWNRLRHRLAHGERRKDAPRAFAEMSSIIHTAFYRIIFEIVDYSGPYRDFGTLGWPTQSYRPAGVNQSPKMSGITVR